MKPETYSSYNGWVNIETWRAATELANSEKHYRATCGMDAADLLAYMQQHGFDTDNVNVKELSDFFNGRQM